MAAGDNASRANRFDVAREWLTQARDELERLGVTYYALRSEGALCTVLARRGRYREAIACEERLIPRWYAQQEKREAAVREMSAGNLRLRHKEFTEAQLHFQRVEAFDSQLPPLLRSRLQTGLGNLALSRGDLPGAAKSFAQAAQSLGNGGLPVEQANLDLKLAHLARFSGAAPERLRLLQAASANLKGSEDPLRLAEIELLLGEAQRQQGDATAALVTVARATALCSGRSDPPCADDAVMIEILTLLDLGRVGAARAKFAALESNATLTTPRRELLAARLDLADGNPRYALQRLSALGDGAGDPEFQAEHALLLGHVLSTLGQRRAALTQLRTTLLQQAAQTSGWPSTALRISARDRLARLQSALFDRALDGTGDVIAAEDFSYVQEAIDSAAAAQLFADANGAPLPPNLRETLSAAIAGGSFARQRELFAALATDNAAAPPMKNPIVRTAVNKPVDPALLVLIPLAGEREFQLLALQASQIRRCLRWPIARYDDLANRFAAALDGETIELAALQAAAESLHADIRRCSAGAVAPLRWQVVRVAGTPALPWAWVAAATPGTAGEPTVTQTFATTGQPLPLSKPTELLLLDLDMPRAAPLPLASREVALLDMELRRHGITPRQTHAADLPADAVLAELAAAPAVHVIGHANPAAFGQLYQGLWYEAGGKPSLLTYPEIAASRIRAGLVVLSACGTHAAEATSFGTSAHLAEAFIAAGAAHVVAAANPLSDAAAPLWSTRFHSVLWSGADVAIAAREARAALRATPHFRSPRYWAGIEHFATASRSITNSLSP
nr:CHAT domain-containing protein [Tahibacter caeni]